MRPSGATAFWLTLRYRGIPRNEPEPEAVSGPPRVVIKCRIVFPLISYRVVAQEFVVHRSRARRVRVSGAQVSMLQIVRAFPRFLSDGVAPIDHTA
jgi:hypothetical protein